jgi:hypothetical protein
LSRCSFYPGKDEAACADEREREKEEGKKYNYHVYKEREIYQPFHLEKERKEKSNKILGIEV